MILVQFGDGVGNYVIISFEVKTEKDPVYWLKLELVEQLMKGLEHENVPSWFETVQLMVVRKCSGGISEKLMMKNMVRLFLYSAWMAKMTFKGMPTASKSSANSAPPQISQVH